MGIIQDLIDEGALVLYHDYRAGHLLDLSGQGNDGVATAVMWGRGAHFPGSTSKVTVADAAELQLTEGTLIALGDFTSQRGTDTFIAKRDAGGTNYQYDTAAGKVRLYDGTNAREINTNTIGSKCVAVNFKDGETAELFKDGASAGSFNAASAISADNAPITLGNWYGNGRNNQSPMHAAIIVNRKLTASEHAALYAELASLTWPTKASGRGQATLGPELLTDGDMEAATTGAYTAGNAAILTKEAGNALSESQVLRVAHNGTANPFASQVVLATGTKYRFRGWARGDGTGIPEIKAGSLVVWTGTASTSWQWFDVILTTDGTTYYLKTTIAVAGYCEFDNVTIKQIYADEVQFKTDFGVHAPNVNRTAGFIENSPFEIVSGTHKVFAIISGDETIKQIDTVVAGIYALDAKLLHADPTLAAYGTWEWWMYKGGAGTAPRVIFVATDTVPTAGYALQFRNDEAVRLSEHGVDVLCETVASYINVGQWYKVKVTRRQSDGQFSVYIDDELVDVTGGSGANPVTDNTTKTSAYMVFDMDAGDSIALSTQRGEYALVKKLGLS